MTERLPALFCDGIIEAQVVNGVARLTLGQAGADGKPFPCGQLILPITQLPGAANALANLVKQIQEKVKEAQAQAQAQAQQASEAPPSAFRFS
ncbi:hypothetical protein [Elioraea thermophila]|uniref:hypothetical protein n=1 Tax=Elioraea thermophila TaxID=2185104 RepID=UPI000DF231FF|nr:hypothetical protein [Elioraea thermophila]